MKLIRRLMAVILALAVVITTGLAGGLSSDAAENTAAAGKVLVAYFSASGNTERIAQEIAAAIDGDLFEITPAEPYTSADLNWTNQDSRVNREHEDESLRDIALAVTTPADFDSYSVVFIGYPIWWGDASWVVHNFVQGNDFTGKTVIPFCTSSSSPIGESGHNLEAMAGTGTWLEGRRFSGSASANTVAEWVNSLDLPAAETPVRFTDVTDPGSYYYTPVYWAVAAGVTNGTSATTFSPDQDVRRDEFVTFLWRLSGSREPQGTASFTDLAGKSDAFRKAISWAEENGIVAGVGGDRFDPSGTVTREQAATILYRYYKGTTPAASAGFTDVADSWYTDAVNWGYAQGIIAGYGTRFGVGDPMTRAQAVTFLYRAENRS